MGRVYKAEHRLMKRLVALKVLDPRQATCPAAFRREAEAAARLRHPHIVLTHDAVERRGRRFLVMEYVDGVDLEVLVRRRGPLPPTLVGEALRQTALALDYAWQRGFVHNDVKPANLMLLRGPDKVFKLLDLGLARPAGGADVTPLVGTPNFLAPERADEPDRVDVRSDLYSLGCTAFFLLTGQPPYPGGDWPDKLERHRLAPVPSARALRPEVPDGLDALVRRLMSKAPEARYASPAEMLAALTPPSVPSSGPHETSGTQKSFETPKRAAPRKGALVGVVAAALLGLLFLAAARYDPPPSAAPASPPAGPRPFVVESAGAFAPLAEAVDAARDGDRLTVRGVGPYPTPPLRWQAKALTLCGEPGRTPCLELRPGPDDPPWRALLATDRALNLQGLELRHAPDLPQPAGSLVCVEAAALHLGDCRLRSLGAHAAVVLLRGPELQLYNCRVEGEAVVLSVEVGQPGRCRVAASRCRLLAHAPGGVALSLWGEPTAVQLDLHDNDVSADQDVTTHGLATLRRSVGLEDASSKRR
jgi:hypothetical protein